MIVSNLYRARPFGRVLVTTARPPLTLALLAPLSVVAESLFASSAMALRLELALSALEGAPSVSATLAVSAMLSVSTSSSSVSSFS